MSELKDLVRAVRDLRRRQREFLVATLVGVQGSSFRRPGARMLLSEDRWTLGSVSGGRAEQILFRRGFWQTRENAPVLVTYDANSDDDIGWGLGFGIDGAFHVLIERVGPRTSLDPLVFIEQCLQAQRRGSIATVVRTESPHIHVGARIFVTADGDVESNGLPGGLYRPVVEECCQAIASGTTAVHTFTDGGASVDVLVEAIVPPPRLFLFGAGQDAAPVANLARAVGWDVFICVRRARFEMRARFAPADAVVIANAANISALVRASDRALAIVMTHDDQSDRDALALMLRSPVRYIGVLGPRERTARMLAELGYDEADDPRVHAPIGLPLGTETPQVIALAMIAKAQSVLASPSPDVRELRAMESRASRGRRARRSSHASPT